MTTTTDAATSDFADVNISISTTPTVVPGSSAGHRPMSLAISMFLRVAILIIVHVFNLGGNGFTLVTIRMTPRLWTKTNFILASMLLSNIVTGVFAFWYSPFVIAVYVFNNPCRFNVAIAALTPLMKMTPLASIFHLILISVERYIAIVYPLHYESKFTDRTLKWAIFSMWASGIFAGMTYTLWLIDADLRRCILIPVQYNLVEVLAYAFACISMFICYGKILAISRRHRRRIEVEPLDVVAATGTPRGQTSSFATDPLAHSSTATSINDTVDPNGKPLTRIGVSSQRAVTNDAAGAEPTREQQRQKIKSRRREFKAVYLTAAIVGTFVVLWFPHNLGRVLESVGYDAVVTGYIFNAGGAIGSANFAFSWVIYAAVSKSYRRAYRQMLNRIGCCCCKNITLPADNSLVV